MRKRLSDQNLCGQACKTDESVSLYLTKHSEFFERKLFETSTCMVLANCCLEVIFIRDNNEKNTMKI